VNGAAAVRQTPRAAASRILERIAGRLRGEVALMEVCGTHTMAIGRHGLRAGLPGALRLLSGPGCPVCVTPCEVIDRALAMLGEPGVTLASFGDMMRVPGSTSSLALEMARGADVRVVYSPLEALELARSQPRQNVVFLGIGFETTAPTVAATLLRAAGQAVHNFAVLAAFKLVPPAMEALLRQEDVRIDGFICPGHVSTIIGEAPYRTLAETYGVPCVITGFEALDILEGIDMLLAQIGDGRAEVEVQYRRAVPASGNRNALELMARIFRVTDASWRGIGTIPASGLELAEHLDGFDAVLRIPVEVEAASEPPAGCACGEVMRGRLVPPECPLFGRRCTPGTPVGPCMVSSEGACAAYLRYGLQGGNSTGRGAS
jgi:hydrogenase expression/formation protein HypD